MLKKIFAVSISIIMLMNFMACTSKDKESILLKDVKSQSKVEEQEIRTAIDNGNKYLEEGNYDKAKKWYERAISISKSSVDTYVKIKNKYLEKNRKDDAYRIIRLAIDNNVDVENMKKELKKIEDTFEIIVINKSIYVGEDYELPSESTLYIADNNVNGKITWNNSKVTTNKSGIFIYKGSIPLYGRKVVMNLEVKNKELVSNKVKNELDDENNKNIVEMSFITSITEDSMNKYVKIDTVEFFKDEEAVKEAVKDGCAAFDNEENQYFLPDDYYIRNSIVDNKSYKISNRCIYKLCNYNIELYSTTNNKSALIHDLEESDFDTFKKAVDNSRLLCKVYIENNEVVKLEQQFLP